MIGTLILVKTMELALMALSLLVTAPVPGLEKCAIWIMDGINNCDDVDCSNGTYMLIYVNVVWGMMIGFVKSVLMTVDM